MIKTRSRPDGPCYIEPLLCDTQFTFCIANLLDWRMRSNGLGMAKDNVRAGHHRADELNGLAKRMCWIRNV